MKNSQNRIKTHIEYTLSIRIDWNVGDYVVNLNGFSIWHDENNIISFFCCCFNGVMKRTFINLNISHAMNLSVHK